MTEKKNSSLWEKLLTVQMAIGAIKRDSTNPFFQSKYFDINSLLAEVKPILNGQGLVLLQPLGVTSSGGLALNTIIRDAENGEEFSYFCSLPEGLDAQKSGSAITYFRRYALQSMLALEAEDDDANAAKPKVKKAPEYPKSEVINEEDLPF